LKTQGTFTTKINRVRLERPSKIILQRYFFRNLLYLLIHLSNSFLNLKEVVKQKGLDNITVEDLVLEMIPKGRALVPGNISFYFNIFLVRSY
jgi:hypothetical protein